MSVKMIVAIGKDGAIGQNGDLIWKIPDDLKRFKALTTGHPVIMGRKTWESLPKKPLPNRKNIILTRQKDFEVSGAETAHSIDEALDLTANQDCFIIGGAEIYKAFMPIVSELFLTVVDATCPDADAFLNLNLSEDWEKTEESPLMSTPAGLNYKYITYKRLN